MANGGKRIVLGLGSGRCGTLTLARLLDAQPGFSVTHECIPAPWEFSEASYRKLCEELASRPAPVVGDVASYHLPYVPRFFADFDDVRCVCLRRERAEVVDSFLRITPDRNHWTDPASAFWSDRWRPDPAWDPCFPKYPLDKAEAIAAYWEEYYAAAADLARRFPGRFLVADMRDALNNRETQMRILDFVGAPSQGRVVAVGRITNISRRARVERFYINLDRRPDRRERIENELRAAGLSAARISAVDGRSLPERPGSPLSRGERAVWESHLRALRASEDPAAFVHILEDDARIGRSCRTVLEQIVERAQREPRWDVLYTEVGLYPTGIAGFSSLLAMLTRQRRQQRFRIADLVQLAQRAQVAFSGATSYLVHPRSRARVLELLQTRREMQPYDLALRDLIGSGRLRGAAVFPFLTGVCLESGSDLRRTDASVAAQMLLRSAFFSDADLGAIEAQARALAGAQTFSQEERVMALLLPLLTVRFTEPATLRH